MTFIPGHPDDFGLAHGFALSLISAMIASFFLVTCSYPEGLPFWVYIMYGVVSSTFNFYVLLKIIWALYQIAFAVRDGYRFLQRLFTETAHLLDRVQ